MAGEPVGHESNSQGWVRTDGVAVEFPVPDLSSAGQDKMAYQLEYFKNDIIKSRNIRYTQLQW